MATGSFTPSGAQYIPPFPIEKVLPKSIQDRMTAQEKKDAVAAVKDWEQKLSKALSK